VTQTARSKDDPQWLIADIGGTHARLACWQASTGIVQALRLVNDDYASPHALIADYAARAGCGAERAVLALAMPVGGETASLTNRAWDFSPDRLLARLGWEEVRIVNDFAAAAAGVESLPPEAFERVCGDGAIGPDTRLVLGPGTGLGAAAVIGALAPTLIAASEAGHMTFAPSRIEQSDLIEPARARWGRVSWERILCGAGLAWLDAHERGLTEPLAPAEVAARARQGESFATRAVTCFSRLLGEFAGDLCLAFTAFGGVSLCGGVLDGLGSTFDRAAFASGFIDKGRFAARLRGVTCRRVSGLDVGLLGLAHYLAGGCAMPTVHARRSSVT
jgi:glucokinase